MTTKPLLVAVYDPSAQTLQCPHCGATLPVSDWTLIETGYEQYWALNHDDADGVTAIHSEVSDTGHDEYVLSHLECLSADPTAAPCYERSRRPPDFRWAWT